MSFLGISNVSLSEVPAHQAVGGHAWKRIRRETLQAPLVLSRIFKTFELTVCCFKNDVIFLGCLKRQLFTPYFGRNLFEELTAFFACDS